MLCVSTPTQLQTIIDTFHGAPSKLRLPLLLEYAGKLPDLPEGMEGQLEQVHECQTPLFLHVATDEDAKVHLYFKAPQEAPTTRGFAAVVHAGLEGLSVEEVLDTPLDFYEAMGLSELISPLRLRGMGSIVARVKRRLRTASAGQGRTENSTTG